MPPSPEEFAASPVTMAGPITLSRPTPGSRKARSTPTPSPTPGAAASATPGPATGPTPTPQDSSAAGGDLPAANASPAPPADPAFIQAYEAAYVQFLKEDYDGARELLDKADNLQAGQPNSVSLRNQIFKHFYGEAYLKYASKDYDGAVKQLDSADKVLSNQADANNMRGLIFSRQKNYPLAEEMFKKSIAQDPTFWEAKFNLAELPFIYRNYTEARTRFEDLFSHTDPAKQPKEAELTEFKVFLTLLLEGKEPGARAFMERFNFSGATPARYYCQAALDFYHGDTDKALGWISSARKEYPAKLEGIFAQSFFRVGWLTDANAAALAAATPSKEPVPAASAGTPATVASTEMAMASPAKPLDLATPANPTAAPAEAAGASVTPVPSLLPTPGRAAPARVTGKSATPLPTLTPVPSITPASTATPTPELGSSGDVLRVPTPTPAPAVAESTPSQTPAGTPVPTPQPAAKADGGMSAGDAIVLGILALAGLMTLMNVFIVLQVIKAKEARRAKKPLRYSGQTAAKP